jgi:hypothetical protein
MLPPLVLALCAHLSTSFNLQSGPLHTGRTTSRSRRAIASDGEVEVKVNVKPPSAKTAEPEDAKSTSSGSSSVNIRVRPKSEPASEVPDAADEAVETKVTIKAPKAVAVVAEEESGDPVPTEPAGPQELLMTAFEAGNCTLLLEALQMGANPNIRDPKGRTPLHFVAGIGLAPACVLLIHFGAQVDVQDEDGLTPMHMAAGYANAMTLKVLIAAGGDPELAGTTQGTPMEIVTNLAEFQYEDFMKQKMESMSPMKRFQKKDPKLDKLIRCTEVLESREKILNETVWENELSEVLKTIKLNNS